MSDPFTYTDEQWYAIRHVVGVVCDIDADQVTLERSSVDGKILHTVTLRAEIEAAARIHLLRSRALHKLPTAMKFLDFLTTLREDAESLGNRILESKVFWSDVAGHAADADMAKLSEDYFPKLLRNLDGKIAALGKPRKHKSASKAGRDLFWADLLAIWREVFGAANNVATANFLIAASKPVFGAMPKNAADAVPDKRTVVEWVRRHRASTRPRGALPKMNCVS